MNSETNGEANNGAAALVLDWLGHQRLGGVLTSGALSVLPVYAGQIPNATDYRTLHEAIILGEALITEQSQATVNSLQIVNRGPLPVLILDGEEVIGGLQNRVVNTTLLIPPKTSFDLPVSCVEHGRWHQTSSVFEASEAVHPALRRQKSQQVTASLHRATPPLADQNAIWAEVEVRHRLTRTSSTTAALRDAYAQRRPDLERIVGGLACPSDGPTGMIALVGGKAQCADLFDQPETLRVYWARLVRSYALEALDRKPDEPSLASATGLLRRPVGAIVMPFASVGVGMDVRINGNGVVGAALVHGTNVVHTSLFRHSERATRSHLQSPRVRARRIVGGSSTDASRPPGDGRAGLARE